MSRHEKLTHGMRNWREHPEFYKEVILAFHFVSKLRNYLDWLKPSFPKTGACVPSSFVRFSVLFHPKKLTKLKMLLQVAQVRDITKREPVHHTDEDGTSGLERSQQEDQMVQLDTSVKALEGLVMEWASYGPVVKDEPETTMSENNENGKQGFDSHSYLNLLQIRII